MNKLFELAEGLGLRETRQAGRPQSGRRESADSRTNVSQGRATEFGSGLKLSISPEASRLADSPGEKPDSDQSTQRLPSETRATPASHSHRNRAIAAYQRNASAVSGEKIRVIA